MGSEMCIRDREQLAPARVLTEEQRLHYFVHGYLHLPAHVSAEWLHRINAVTNEFVELSRSVVPGQPGGFPDREAAKDPSNFFVLEAGHTAELPRLTRLTSPVDLHDTYWEYVNGPVRASYAPPRTPLPCETALECSLPLCCNFTCHVLLTTTTPDGLAVCAFRLRILS